MKKPMTDRRRNQVVRALLPPFGAAMSADGVILESRPDEPSGPDDRRRDEIVNMLGGPMPREKTGGERAFDALRAAATPAEWAKFNELFDKAQRGKKNANRVVFELMLSGLEKEANR